MKHRYTNKLPPKNANETCRGIKASKEKNLEDLEAMTKEELIQELVKARITEARLKKSYEVKGDGSVILYDNKNIK